MRLMGIEAIYPKPRTSRPHPAHKVYPYLLRNLPINRPNQVWTADITYIPMNHGFMYLVAVMDWYDRKILSWRVSNTMEPAFCVDALEDALDNYGAPEIFNTDQGSQTNNAFPQILKDNHVASVWMAGGSQDNIFVELLWWTLKHQYVYLHSFDTGTALRRGLAWWIRYNNKDRGHSSLDDKTTDKVYYGLVHPHAEAV